MATKSQFTTIENTPQVIIMANHGSKLLSKSHLKRKKQPFHVSWQINITILTAQEILYTPHFQ